MTSIVFSKDRAMQLDAFLRSYHKNVTPQEFVRALCSASTARHVRAYAEVAKRHAWAEIVWQGNSFKASLLELLPSEGYVIFFVDDQVFVRPWIVVEREGLSLRLAPHLTWCYPTGGAQPVPVLHSAEGTLLSWRWADGHGDWGYPLSLDGHVFNLAEVRPLIAEAVFHSPNTLESALQSFTPLFLDRFGLCYRQARVVNVPWNRVQNDYENRHGDAADAGEMLDLWESGRQINIEPLQGMENVSCHQEFPLMTEGRA